MLFKEAKRERGSGVERISTSNKEILFYGIVESKQYKEEYEDTMKVWDAGKFGINGLKVLGLHYSWS